MSSNNKDKSFPIACLGGSAGSVEAYFRILKALPANCGLAIVIVNHMRRVPTKLPQILPSHTGMPVQLIRDGLLVERNHVYVIPRNCDLTLEHGAFRLTPLSKAHGFPRVISIFLASLAHEWEGKPIAVILSGLDSDGVEALREIKAAGGITISQEPDTAPYPDMPHHAIESGWIDFVLPPEAIARELVRIACPG